MKKRTLLAMATGILAMSVAVVSQAAEYIFPGAGGELSVPGDWGDAAPGTSDSITINQNGSYTISSDLEVDAITITANSQSISATDGVKITLNAANRGNALLGKVNKMNGMTLSGGFYYSPNGASFFPLYASNLDLRQPGSTATLSGVSISNLYIFAAANRFNEAKTTLTNGSRVWMQTLQVGTGVGGGCTLEVTGGSRLECSQHFYPDGSTDNSGCNLLDVFGSESYVSVGGSPYVGSYSSNSTIRIRDCATMKSGGFLLGRNYGGNTLEFSNNATGILSSVEMGTVSGKPAHSNMFMIASGSSVTMSAKLVVGTYTSDNALVVDDALLTISGGINLGNNKDAAATRNSITLRGRNPQIIAGASQTLTTYNTSTIRFDVPEEGFAGIPLQCTKYNFGGDVTFEVECKKFRKAGGGDIVLAQATNAAWIDQSGGNLASRLPAMNAAQPEGCSFEIKGAQIIYHAPYLPPKGMRMTIR